MSKPIGDLTLKAAPVGADMIAIADSQDSNKTKKILVSSIAGGGAAISVTAPLDFTSNVLSIPQSGNGVDGYLSGTDWVKFNSKAITQSLVENSSTTPSLTVNDATFYNKVYRYTDPLTSLTLTGAPIETTTSTYRYETEIQFTTDSTFTFTAAGLVGKWIGVDAPTFEANTKYIIAIKNGYAVLGKVGA